MPNNKKRKGVRRRECAMSCGIDAQHLLTCLPDIIARLDAIIAVCDHLPDATYMEYKIPFASGEMGIYSTLAAKHASVLKKHRRVLHSDGLSEAINKVFWPAYMAIQRDTPVRIALEDLLLMVMCNRALELPEHALQPTGYSVGSILTCKCCNPECSRLYVDAKLRSCRCNVVRYCSRQCQLQHRPTHKTLCSACAHFSQDATINRSSIIQQHLNGSQQQKQPGGLPSLCMHTRHMTLHEFLRGSWDEDKQCYVL